MGTPTRRWDEDVEWGHPPGVGTNGDTHPASPRLLNAGDVR